MTFESSRSKQVIVLQPRSKALYEDDSSFGSKMLTKMGWKKGNGLGKEQDGNLDFIQIRYKNNNNGLGYDQWANKRDNGWTSTEAQFEKLLSSLNGDSTQSTGPKESNPVMSGIKSLEERSRSSRVRVHYRKLTRGKDVYKYNEKDLANILGRKSLNDSCTSKGDDDVLEKSPEQANERQVDKVTTSETISTKDEQICLDKLEVSSYEPETEQALNSDMEKSSLTNYRKGVKREMKTSGIANEKESSDCSLPKLKRKKVSHETRQSSASTENAAEPEALTDTYVLQVPSNVAQKLSFMVIESFKGANISNIVGYGFSEKMEIKILQTKLAESIDCATNKYSLYNMDHLAKQKFNPRKIISKLKRTKKSIQVI